MDAHIKKACGDFKGLADISVVVEERYYRVRFRNCNYPEQITMNEFENYIIDLMAKK